ERASGGPEDPQSWNRYAYSQSDPINYNDSGGMFSEPAQPDPCNINYIPPPDPSTDDSTCKIFPYTSGALHAHYQGIGSNRLAPHTNPNWGNGEHISSDKWWTFLYEVQVTFSNPNFKQDWVFNRRAVFTVVNYLVGVNGEPVPVDGHTEILDPDFGKDPSNFFNLESNWSGDDFWIYDTPGYPMYYDDPGRSNPILSTKMIWQFTITMSNKVNGN